MKWAIIALFGFTCFLIFVSVMQMIFLSDRKLNKRLNRYLHLNDKNKLGRKGFNRMVQMSLYKQLVREKVMSKKQGDRIASMLSRAGMNLRPEEFILFRWVATVLGGGVFYLISGNIPLFIVGAIVGHMLPAWYLKKRIKTRITAFNDGLQDMITTIIGSIRAGFSFAQALKTVVHESEDPIRSEMELMLKEMQFGTSMEDALHNLKERMPSADLDLMIQSILIQRQIGGNLAVILETIVQTIRDRNRLGRQIKALTAQGRLSGIVIGLLPVALTAIMYMIAPDYIGALFETPIGLILVGVGAVTGTTGFILVQKMTRIEV